MSAYGRVLDATRDRALFVDEVGVRMLYRDHCDNVTLGPPLPDALSEKLTSRGAIVMANSTVIEYRDGQVISHGGAYERTLVVAGDYAHWEESIGLGSYSGVRLQISTGTKTTIPAATQNNATDLGPNGAVAYRTSAGTFINDVNNVTTTVRTGSTDVPRTDGTLVVGSLRPPTGDCTIFAWKAGVFESLVDWPTCIPDRHFQVANGRVAFVRPHQFGPQAMLREADGTQTLIARAKWIDRLSPTGAMLLHVEPAERHRPNSNQTTTYINKLGESVADNDAFLVIVGRTVFGVETAPPCSTPECSSACDGGGIRPPVMGTGTDAGVDAAVATPDAYVPPGSTPDAAPGSGGGGGGGCATSREPRGFTLIALLVAVALRSRYRLSDHSTRAHRAPGSGPQATSRTGRARSCERGARARHARRRRR